MFKTPFAEYACVGDCRDTVVDNFTVTARIVHDDDASIDDDDCHNTDRSVTGCTPEEHARLMEAREAYEAGEWFYCAIVLTVSRGGVDLDDHAASLWGIECDYPGTDNSYLLDVANELLPEAIISGEVALARLTNATS